MKKIIISNLLILLAAMSSCESKIEETSDNHQQMMNSDSTMMHHDSTHMHSHSTLYSCSMHPEIKGNLNDECSKCGMKLTEPVTVK